MDISYSSNITAPSWNTFDASIYDSYYAELEKQILLLMGDDDDDDNQGPQQLIGETRGDSSMPVSTGLPLWPDQVGYRKVPEPIQNPQPKPVNVTENGNGTGVFIPLPVLRTVHSGRANRQRRRTYKRIATA